MQSSPLNLPPTFPFTAVVGQPTLKMALLLCVVDRQLGGVLISGPRGVAKTTLVRAMAALLPSKGDFVDLPLGCTSAQLTGALDIDQALSQRKAVLRPGLLAKAHEGILYVDEVNLLSDLLVDQLLDVSATGIQRVERDGFSQTYPASFVLVGTMNPDEGELRPQLSDRFGLCVQLNERPSREDRVAIARARRAYERDPIAFCREEDDAMQALRARLAKARQMLANVWLPEILEYEIADRCLEAGVEGVRADMAWQRAAMAHAALNGREETTLGDVECVAPLVLVHRRAKNDTPSSSSSRRMEHGRSHDAPNATSSTLLPPSPFDGDLPSGMAQETIISGTQGSTENSGTLTEDAPPQYQETVWLPKFSTPHRNNHTSYLPHLTSAGRTHHCGSESIDWEATLTHPDNVRNTSLTTLVPPNEVKDVGDVVIIMVDASASVREAQGFRHASRVVEALMIRAIATKRRIALLYFQGHDVVWLAKGDRRAHHALTALRKILPSGGTPLAKALQRGMCWLMRWQNRYPSSLIEGWLVTDARYPWSTLPAWTAPLTVVDTECGTRRFGRGTALAETLKARYLPMSALTVPE